MFVGREPELQELTGKLTDRKFEAILLYGKRRVGKTELIRRAAESFDGMFLYYECKRSLFSDNLGGLNEYLKKMFGYGCSFQSFRDMIQFVLEQSRRTLILFILDELPFLITENKRVISDIRNLIDEYRGKTTCKLVFMGSDTNIMKSLIEENSDTKNSFTGIIELKPFDYYDAAKFYPDYRDEDKILMYSVFGGVAYYNSLIDPSLTPLENIKKLLLMPNSILQLEIEHTISSETNKTPMLNSLIEIICSGSTKYSEITGRLTAKNKKPVNIDYLLKKLVDMGIIEKRVPINDRGNRKKHSYCFSDNLIHFYYHYIFRNINSFMETEDYYNEFVKKDLEARYLPLKFEEISREYLIRAGRKEIITPIINEVGIYLYDDRKKGVHREFHAVSGDRNGYTAYKCIYSDKPVSLPEIREEESQIQDCGINFYRLGYISRSGFVPEISKEKYSLITLPEFYSAKLADTNYEAEDRYDCFQDQYTLTGFFK